MLSVAIHVIDGVGLACEKCWIVYVLIRLRTEGAVSFLPLLYLPKKVPS
jgi:hypothetical protein